MNTYISKLHVANVGLFDCLDIEFSPEVNVIVGVNNSGKTSILKNLAFCFSNFGLNFTRLRKDAEFWADITVDGRVLRSGATKIVSKDQDYRQTNPEYFGQVPRLGAHEIFPPHGQINYNIFAIGAYRYFDYTRINGMSREQKGRQRRDYYLQNNHGFLDNPSLPPIKQWMINRYFITEKNWAKVEKNNWERIINFLPHLVPPTQRFKFERIERDLEVVFSLNGRECYLEELSGGFKSILSIIFSIIDWCEGVNEGELSLLENARGTVLIDEIDVHLHPEWQGLIVDILRQIFPSIQFIITTHSPYVVASAAKGEIIALPKHSGSVNLRPVEKSFHGWQIQDILNDLMGVTGPNEYETEELLRRLDESLERKDRDLFEKELFRLKETLHRNDPILKYYEIKRSNLFL